MKPARVDDLPPDVQAAVRIFRESDIGNQLADADEAAGRCRPASSSFISALREVGEDGFIVEFADDDWWHHTVMLRGTDVVIDWTSAQFIGGNLAAAHRGYPTVTPRSEHEEVLGEGTVVDPDDAQDRFLHVVDQVMPWDVASRRVPDSKRDPVPPADARPR